jgi:regulator of RNase E activity RraA
MECTWKSDEELFAMARRELFTAVVGDVMDIMGYRNQFLPPEIQPLRDDMVVIGRAMPVLEADDTGGEGPGRPNELMNRPFGLMLRALDDLKPNEVYMCSGSSPTYALWGELMSMAASNVEVLEKVMEIGKEVEFLSSRTDCDHTQVFFAVFFLEKLNRLMHPFTP